MSDASVSLRRKKGMLHSDGGLHVHRSIVNIVLHD